MMTKHLTMAELEAGLAEIQQSPQDNGIVEMIVTRPEVDKREVITTGNFTPEAGLVGDNWQIRGSNRSPDDSGHPEMQIAIMNARAIRLLAQDESHWALAGDQLFVDLDLSAANLACGQRLAVGTAVLEITPTAHTGCKKFAQRYGVDAVKFVNSPEGKRLHLRGIYARVVQAGAIQVGDVVKKI